MGYDAYAVVFCGIKRNTFDFETKTKIRACEHNIGPNDKYCPECGERAFKEITENKLLDAAHFGEKYKDLEIMQRDNEEDVIYIGMKIMETGRDDKSKERCYNEIGKIMTYVKETLAKSGIKYEESEIVIWAILIENY